MSYIDNNRLRKLITSAYTRKARNGVILITATALCHVAKSQGLMFPAIPISDFGITSLFQLMKKRVVTVLLSTGIPLLVLETGAIAFGGGWLLIAIGMMLSHYRFENISTTMITNQVVEKIERRIPDVIDIVAVNVKDTGSSTKIEMPKYECQILGQLLLNPNCKSNFIKTYDQINIDFTDVVGMKDVTGLEKHIFSDEVYFLGNKNFPGNKNIKSPKGRGKMVKFSEKFKDICEDIDSSTDEVNNHYLRNNNNHKLRRKEGE